MARVPCRLCNDALSPWDLMTQKFGVEFADLFNIRRIPANDVVLKPSLLGIEQKVRPEILKATDPENKTK